MEFFLLSREGHFPQKSKKEHGLKLPKYSFKNNLFFSIWGYGKFHTFLKASQVQSFKNKHESIYYCCKSFLIIWTVEIAYTASKHCI